MIANKIWLLPVVADIWAAPVYALYNSLVYGNPPINKVPLGDDTLVIGILADTVTMFWNFIYRAAVVPTVTEPLPTTTVGVQFPDSEPGPHAYKLNDEGKLLLVIAAQEWWESEGKHMEWPAVDSNE